MQEKAKQCEQEVRAILEKYGFELKISQNLIFVPLVSDTATGVANPIQNDESNKEA